MAKTTTSAGPPGVESLPRRPPGERDDRDRTFATRPRSTDSPSERNAFEGLIRP